VETVVVFLCGIVVPVVGIFCYVSKLELKERAKGEVKPFTYELPLSKDKRTLRKVSKNEYEYQWYSPSGWTEYSHVSGSPTHLSVKVFEENRSFSFNPWDYFDNPYKPTKGELEMFSIEFNYDYNRCKKGFIKIDGLNRENH